MTVSDSKVTVKTKLLSPRKPCTGVGLTRVVTEVTVTLQKLFKYVLFSVFPQLMKKLTFFLT